MSKTQIFEFTVGGRSSKQEIRGPSMKDRLDNFAVYFQSQLDVVLSRLSVAGRNASRKALRESTTPWGFARIEGNYGGVRFKPYGRSAGREDTGFMMESLSGGLETVRLDQMPGKETFVGDKQAFFGWSRETISSNPYIAMQENGFYSNGSFDPEKTASDGVARFKAGAKKYIEGADSLSFGLDKVKQIEQSFFAGAWNEAVKQWNADGFTGSQGSYVDRRQSVLKFKQKRRSRSNYRDRF